MIHPQYWNNLSNLAPEDVCRRTMASFDAKKNLYCLRVLDRELAVDLNARKLYQPGMKDSPEKNFNLYIMTVQYLMNAVDEPPAGEWVTEKELKSGDFFFRKPHEIEVAGIEHLYGKDPEGFLKKGLSLGGEKAAMGDAAVKLRVLPRIEVIYILWKGDEEFPPRVKVLFDRNADRQMPLDALWAMTNYIHKRFVTP